MKERKKEVIVGTKNQVFIEFFKQLALISGNEECKNYYHNQARCLKNDTNSLDKKYRATITTM